MKFAGTKRNTYSKDRVKAMRKARLASKPKIEGVTPEQYRYTIGELAGAGHLKISGTNVKVSRDKEPDTIGLGMNIYEYGISFKVSASYAGLDERPHFSGYVESASNSDTKPYRVKGWFNPDGTMRIEIVK
jgi:hypothetical protein